jgi:hypothetical protein
MGRESLFIYLRKEEEKKKKKKEDKNEDYSLNSEKTSTMH